MIYYYPRKSLARVFRQMMRYGYGRALFIFKHPERFTIETIVPAGFVLTICILTISGVVFAQMLELLFALLLLYGAVLIIEGLRMNVRYGKRFYGKVPAIIAIIHAGLGMGFLRGLARKTLRMGDR